MMGQFSDYRRVIYLIAATHAGHLDDATLWFLPRQLGHFKVCAVHVLES